MQEAPSTPIRRYKFLQLGIQGSNDARSILFDLAILINAPLRLLFLMSSRGKTGSKARRPHGAGANLVCSLLSFYCLSERSHRAIARATGSSFLSGRRSRWPRRDATRRHASFPENFLRIPRTLEAVQPSKIGKRALPHGRFVISSSAISTRRVSEPNIDFPQLFGRRDFPVTRTLARSHWTARSLRKININMPNGILITVDDYVM